MCAHPQKYWEALTASGFGPIRVSFGSVPCCATCRRIVGDVKLGISPEAKKAAAEFSGTSWRLMLDSKPCPPFNFERSKHGLVPVGWVEKEPELEPPF